MIIKILSSARNFEGIDYSERKNDQGKSRLLAAKNFEALGHGTGEVKKADYINYMKMVSEANPRVKKRQFHAVLSAKERIHTAEELARIAEKYLKAMGYGENPYLIYFHKDTNNNHVHMVSTRVDKQGKKVDDSFEKIRSQKVLLHILKQDPVLEADKAMHESLKYSFSTIAQFKLLLEEKGFKTSEQGHHLQLIKYGIVQSRYSITALVNKISNYQQPEDRIKQLEAILIKNKKGLELDDFCKKLREKFGLNLVLHRNKEHARPYGYTIIDHSKKHVFKGSQIIPLQRLLIPVSMQERSQLLHEYLKKLNVGDKTLYSLNKELASLGFKINSNGVITVAFESDPLHQLTSEDLKKLKYNNRLETARKYSIDSPEERQVLSKLYNVNQDDLPLIGNAIHQPDDYYHDLLINAEQNQSLNDILATRKLEILKLENHFFIWDKARYHLSDFSQLLKNHSIDFTNVRVVDIAKPAEQKQAIGSTKSGAINEIARLFDVTIPEQQQSNNHLRRKKKQRKF